MYYQDFCQGSIPPEVIVNKFGTSNSSVGFTLIGLPGQFGSMELQVNAGNNANEGLCVTTRSKMLRRTKNKFGFRWFNFNLPDLRYHLGAFKTLNAHGETARYALAFNGAALGLLVTDTGSNVFYPLETTPDAKIYEAEFEFVSGGVKVTLMDGSGTVSNSITVTSGIPDQNEQLYFGSCIWSSTTLSATHPLPIDNWWVDMRSDS